MTTLGPYLEENVHAAIKALHSERFYDFTEGLLILLEDAKRTDRMLGSLLAGVGGSDAGFRKRDERFREAEAANDWWIPSENKPRIWED